MSRQVETGTLVVDSFPVFEDDGYTKKSGLLPGDFVVTVLHNGIVQSLPVNIEEIGTTGEYRIQFTPTVDGYYQVEAAIPFNLEIWGWEYDSGVGIPTVMVELEIIKGLLHHNSMIDLQTFSSGQLTSARVRMFDHPDHVPANPGGSETLGLVAEFQIVSAYDDDGLNKKFTLKRVYP